MSSNNAATEILIMPQEWFVRRGDKVRGPLTSEEVKQLVAKGILVASDMVRKSENPEWRQAGTVKGLFGAVRSEAPVPSPQPQSKAEAPFVPVPPPLPSSPANRQAASTPPSTAANVAGTMQAGLTDIMSTAKQAKDLAAAHARRTQITQMTLPKAYLALGKDLFVGERFREEFSDLFQRINTANDEIAKVAATTKERPQATDLKGKLQSGAAQLMAQGQTTKLGYQRESLVRELGKKAFESHGTSAGSPELVSPITSAKEEIARLDKQIAGLSSGKQGSIWQRLPIAALLTVFCWPVGILLVWFNPRLTRRSKWVWTGVSAGAFLVLAIIAPKSKPHVSDVSPSSSDFADADNTKNAEEQSETLAGDYFLSKVGQVQNFSGRFFVINRLLTYSIREVCRKSTTIECEGTEVSVYEGSRIERAVKGNREIRKDGSLLVMNGLFPDLLTGAASDSKNVGEHRFKLGANAGDTWDDNRFQMKFIGIRTFESGSRLIKRAVVEGLLPDPSGMFDIRKEFHFEKGVGLVFHRTTIGNRLSHEYTLATANVDPSGNTQISVPSDPLETAEDFGVIKMYSNSRIPVFQNVPDDIVKHIPKEQMQLVTQMEALCKSAEQRLASAPNPAAMASIEATIRREQADVIRGFSSNPLPINPINGWVGQIRFDENSKGHFTIVLGRLTEVKDHPDPRKGVLYFSSIYNKAFMLVFDIEGAKKEFLDDIALLKSGDWVKCDIPDYEANNLMYVTFDESGKRTFVVHGVFTARANNYGKGCPRISRIRSK